MTFDLRRFPGRTATSGSITLNSARKSRNTQTFWYFLQTGKKWILFDIRDLATKARKPVPELCDTPDFEAINAGTTTYEQVLQRDLQRVADFCASVDAQRLLT